MYLCKNIMYKISKKSNPQIALKHVEDLADSCYAHLLIKGVLQNCCYIFSMQIAAVVLFFSLKMTWCLF